MQTPESKSRSNKKWRDKNPDAFKKYYATRKAQFKHRAVEQRQRNISFIEEEKKGRTCVECKKDYPHFVLQYDHVVGEKVRDVSRMVRDGASLKLIREEIKKCELVCSNCHAIRTYNRRVANLKVKVPAF